MEELLGFILASVGLTLVLADASIIETPRENLKKWFPKTIGSMLGCYMCTGLWSGMFASCFLMEMNILYFLTFMAYFVASAFIIDISSYTGGKRQTKPICLIGLHVIFGLGMFASLFTGDFNGLMTILLYGCIGSMASYLYTFILLYLEAQSVVK